MAIDVSADAMKILKIFEEIFRRDKQIKADLTDPDEITRQRVLQIAPLRCLEDGSLDLSNNICERQIRRIAKYRNNSFFVGSPEAGIKTTSKEKLVGLLAHRWQPASESVWTSVPSIH